MNATDIDALAAAMDRLALSAERAEKALARLAGRMETGVVSIQINQPSYVVPASDPVAVGRFMARQALKAMARNS